MGSRWGSDVSWADGALGRRRDFFFLLAPVSLRLGSFGNDCDGDTGIPSSSSLAVPARVRTMMVLIVNTKESPWGNTVTVEFSEVSRMHLEGYLKRIQTNAGSCYHSKSVVLILRECAWVSKRSVEAIPSLQGCYCSG